MLGLAPFLSCQRPSEPIFWWQQTQRPPPPLSVAKNAGRGRSLGARIDPNTVCTRTSPTVGPLHRGRSVRVRRGALPGVDLPHIAGYERATVASGPSKVCVLGLAVRRTRAGRCRGPFVILESLTIRSVREDLESEIDLVRRAGRGGVCVDWFGYGPCMVVPRPHQDLIGAHSDCILMALPTRSR